MIYFPYLLIFTSVYLTFIYSKQQILHIFFFLQLCHLTCGNSSSPNWDWIQALSNASAESQPLDWQGKWKRKWSRSVLSDSLWPHGLYPTRLLPPWDFSGKNTGVGCHFLLQEIFPTQGLNPGLPHCRQTLYHLSHRTGRELPAYHL